MLVSSHMMKHVIQGQIEVTESFQTFLF